MALVLIAAVVSVGAHEKFKIVGKIAALKKDEIAIKAIDGATYEIDMNEKTVVTDKNHRRLSQSELKVGASAVVMALGHDQFDLEAFEIQLTER